MELDTEVQFLHGVGPRMAEKLKKLGVKTVADLIYNFPRTYDDYTKIIRISDIGRSTEGNQTIKAKIINIANRRTSRRRFTVTEAVVADETGSIKVVWFNQPYLEKMLKAGQELILNGKIEFDSFSSQLQMTSPNRATGPKIVPVYSETVGISSNYISKLVANLSPQILSLKEYLPEKIIGKNHLMEVQEAIINLHLPNNPEDLTRSQYRMAFDELFLFSLQKQLSKKDVLIHKAPEIKIDDVFLRKFASSLPFELTGAQKKSAWQIIKDISMSKPMNRLLNGDVGSGKTVVAAFATAVVVKNGYRVALMAPTEILANQHFETVAKILESYGISVGILTGSKKTDHNVPDVIVGTHALIQERVELENLGLVIIDEQHRFGVNQRGKLLEAKNGLRPHFLSMTATPIPRTMSMVVFADLDVSVIDEMPKNRKSIITKLISDRAEAYSFIRSETSNGHQAFVICPLIEDQSNEGEELILFEEDRKTVVRESQRLQKEVFPELKIGMLHGKLKSKEKEAIMNDFKAKKYDILVSTSVVEVGVDIPNATVMMIENAERFGLAQLHQFRGRVGRSDKQSYCLLLSPSNSETAKKRLGYMESISSGFVLAEKDLELRGPGQMYGYQQSGFWDFKFANIGDRMMIEQATESAKDVAKEIESFPLLIEKISESRIAKHME